MLRSNVVFSFCIAIYPLALNLCDLHFDLSLSENRTILRTIHRKSPVSFHIASARLLC